MVSPSAARRFLEQAAFGPTPADAAHVQTIGFQAWLTEQFNMPQISNYNSLTGSSQGGMPATFLTNAVTNPDQLRQRVAFALSQIFVTSHHEAHLERQHDSVPADADRRRLHQLPPDHGRRDAQPRAWASISTWPTTPRPIPAAGTVANENYAREVMQLFTIGDEAAESGWLVQPDATGNLPIPTYLQTDVTEFARVFTGWTYAPGAPGSRSEWGAYINSATAPWCRIHASTTPARSSC